jgi:hypothetical protein
VHTQSFLRFRLFTSEKGISVVIFVVCIAFRAVPELIAYPYPIGYDVVNYYIPTVANFEEKWNNVSNQFPLYVMFLYLVSVITELPAHSVVVGVAIVMAGIFGISLFCIGRTLLKFGISQSVFIAILAIFQVAILRTMWDLHKDIFSLTTMMFAFSLLTKKDETWKTVALIMALAALTVAADRMIGILFCLSVAVYAIMTRRRDVILTTIVAIGMYSTLIVASYDTSEANPITITDMSKKTTSDFYTPANLMILLAVINGLIAAPAAIGFFIMKNSLLKIPLLVCLAASFSWLVFPENRLLVADRWIILSGIFLSVFAGYGILHIVKNLKPSVSAVASCSILAAFAMIGVAYSVMPHDSPFILFGAVRENIEKFGPVTMQFNSLDIEDNKNLLSAIAWLNENTERNATVVGEKHWRGFMELYLEDGRRYLSSDDPSTLAAALEQQYKHVYLISVKGNLNNTFTIEGIGKRLF